MSNNSNIADILPRNSRIATCQMSIFGVFLVDIDIFNTVSAYN